MEFTLNPSLQQWYNSFSIQTWTGKKLLKIEDYIALYAK